MDPFDLYVRRHRSPLAADPRAGREVLAMQMVRISGPDDALERLAEMELAKTPRERKRAARRRVREQNSMLFDADNKPTLGGRTCCWRLYVELNKNLQRLVVPSRHTCTCGTTWEMQHTVRREVLRG